MSLNERSGQGRQPVTVRHTITSRAAWLMFALVLAASLVPRLYRLATPETYHLHPIRQFQGVMIARQYFERSMNILDPRMEAGVKGDAPPSAVALEFQSMPWLAAVIDKALGRAVPYVGNYLGVLFYAVAAGFFFAIARRFLRDEYALLALIVFCFSTESLKYSRTFMPDFEVLMFSLGALFFWLRYMEDESATDLALTGLMLAMTLLTKINYVYVGGLVLVTALAKWSWGAVSKPWLWAAAAGSLLPAAIYYPYSAKYAAGAQSYVGGMLSTRTPGSILVDLFSPHFYQTVIRGASIMMTPVGLALVLAGSAWVWSQRERMRCGLTPRTFLSAWAAMIAVYFVLMGPTILRPHNYYFLPLLPFGGILIGGLAQQLAESLGWLRGRERAVGWSMVAVAVAGACATVALLGRYYRSVEPEIGLYLDVAHAIERATEPADLVAYDTEDLGWTYFILYYSHRQGWHVWQPRPRAEIEAGIEDARRLGARYLLALSPPEYKYLPAGGYDAAVVSGFARETTPVPMPGGGELIPLRGAARP